MNQFLKTSNYINGAWVTAKNSATLAVTNPATGELLGLVPKCGQEETRQAIAAAATAFQHKNAPRLCLSLPHFF
jgi:succinate-semialdehyde dehydrogenase / glutarate-semialdehyde dehydrogenase